jgi:hypothetical protein
MDDVEGVERSKSNFEAVSLGKGVLMDNIGFPMIITAFKASSMQQIRGEDY